MGGEHIRCPRPWKAGGTTTGVVHPLTVSDDWPVNRSKGATRYRTKDAVRFREIERGWLSAPPAKGPRVDMPDHRSVQLTTRAMSVIYLCPYCSRVEMCRFDQLGTSIETACQRGRVTVVQRISESEDARDAR